MTSPITDQDLDEIAGRAAALYEYATVTDQEGQAALTELTDTDVPALLAEVRRLRAEAVVLEDDSALLAALQAAGVDNWDGYDDALTATP